jgi:hypothetical protein
MLAADIQRQVGWDCVRLRRDYGGNIIRLSQSITSTPGMLIECDVCGWNALYLDVSGSVIMGYCTDDALLLGLEIDDARVFGA